MSLAGLTLVGIFTLATGLHAVTSHITPQYKQVNVRSTALYLIFHCHLKMYVWRGDECPDRFGFLWLFSQAQPAQSDLLLFTPDIRDRIRASMCPRDLMVFTPPEA